MKIQQIFDSYCFSGVSLLVRRLQLFNSSVEHRSFLVGGDACFILKNEYINKHDSGIEKAWWPRARAGA